ncbi:acetoacetate decarboxylase-like protein [Penicillium mononematosum]|uniref:acetoacetate decarboxylase-like protein n=1 Tax=Penicillium mononematosum TaxID=268346 RepID=UPI0025468F1F|nr:acetoacetate decarboxylase-like protein [Penicillium mononematosum]KAJ6189932.1 acetoacetate decarboxylase-like protein [Penicillium mononematosum]
MLVGTLPSATLYNAVPVFAPAYRPAAFPSRFSNINCIVIKYRTDGTHVRTLLPDNLTIEDKPIITTRLISYGCSPIGPYHELLQSVEVEFNGTKYDYSLLIILDNEDAAYSGRELWGSPKVLGSFDFPKTEWTGFIGVVDFPIADILFKPTVLLDIEEHVEPGLNTLFLRILPSPMPDKTPHIRQFTEVEFKLQHRQIWEGVASINFPSQSMFDPLHLTPVEEYISAHYSRGTSATITPVDIHNF